MKNRKNKSKVHTHKKTAYKCQIWTDVLPTPKPVVQIKISLKYRKLYKVAIMKRKGQALFTKLDLSLIPRKQTARPYDLLYQTNITQWLTGMKKTFVTKP